MNILFASSEATPFAKTGGLADVSSALPISLSNAGHNVSVIMPAYAGIDQLGVEIGTTFKTLVIPIGDKTVCGEILKGHFPKTNTTVYFIRHDGYYHRNGLYNSAGVDFQDNCERFIFFCRGVLEAIRLLDLKIDILHCNDWQTGLIPAYLNLLYKSHSPFQVDDPTDTILNDRSERLLTPTQLEQAHQYYDHIKTVFTLHNMRHQGRFGRWEMELTGIDWKYFTYDKMEFYNQLNLLKTGIIFSDAITTVSPKYALEIQSEDFGERLQGVLRLRNDVLLGILNGIDLNEWGPTTDIYLDSPYSHYDVTTVFENKPRCKAALQNECGLPQNADVPLFGIVSRFDHQKGLDLVADVVSDLVQKYGAQFVVLGTGEVELEQRFKYLAQLYPNNVAVLLAFSNKLSHRIEASSDIFLMPSRYEPCGLNQMYSHRYGTLPLVRYTGGLADTVIPASDETIQNGTANGFAFTWATIADLSIALDWAMQCYFHRKEDWKKMVQTAMKQDWSWNRSAKEYLDLYQRLIEGKPIK